MLGREGKGAKTKIGDEMEGQREADGEDRSVGRGKGDVGDEEERRVQEKAYTNNEQCIRVNVVQVGNGSDKEDGAKQTMQKGSGVKMRR